MGESMRVAVLGAGLLGSSVALELASHGIRVDLFEGQRQAMCRASAHNEGKIHLGYVFGNDPSLRTARAMVRGAVTFAPLLRKWLGPDLDRLRVSPPFHYLVHAESLRTPDEVEAHLRNCRALALAEGGGAQPDYFGADYRELPERLPAAEWRALYNPAVTQAVFRTPEIAIDPEALAVLVRRRLAEHPSVRCRMGVRVHGVSRGDESVGVEAETAGEPIRERYQHVINTLWDGRLPVDLSAGIRPDRPWLYRVKYYLRVRGAGLAARVPATTMVLGPFGDVVGYPDDEVLLSWYPEGMRGASSEIAPPEWPAEPDQRLCRELRAAIPAGLGRVIPSVATLPGEALASSRVRGGTIFAWGQGDIDDPESGLHQRYEIGPQSYGRYHTVDTGKLTTAPLFAQAVADRVREAG